MTQNLKLMRIKSRKILQLPATCHSITFLLLGSIAYASQIYAVTPITTTGITTTTHQAKTETNHSAFLPVFIAEFALSQGNINQTLNSYQYLVENYNLPNINERALNIALEFDDIDTALNISRLWVEHYPDDVPAMFYLAHLSLRAHQYGLAAKTLDRILQIDPNADLEGILEGIYPESTEARQALLQALNQINKKEHPSVLVMIAGLEAQSGQFESALKKVNLALRKRPNVPSFVILKANLYFAANQSDDAFKWLDHSSRYQKAPDVGLYEVQHLIRQNKTEDALKKLKRMLKKWPNNEQILFLAGITSIDLQQFSQAEKYLKQLQYSNVYQDQANYYLAVNAERKKDDTLAIELYKAVDGNFYTVSRKNLVSIYLEQQRPADAIRLLTQERVSHPHQASFLYQLQAQILQMMGENQRAITLLNEAIQQMPEDPELIYAQVLLYDPFTDRDALDNALNKLLEIEPNSPTFLNAYAYTLARQNRKLDLARKYAEQALSYAPQQASILDTLGYIAFLQNDFDLAVKALAEAYALSPNLSIGVRYAKALYMHGDIQPFTQLCETLHNQYPDSEEVAQLLHLLVPNSHSQPS